MSNWSFIDHICSLLEKPKLGDSKLPTLWPSEASAVVENEWGEKEVVGRCRRATFLRYLVQNVSFYEKYEHLKTLSDEIKEATIPPDRYLRWIWIQGELYEEYVISAAKASGVFVAEQVPIYIKNANISGKQDIVVINPETGKYSIVECKSVYSFGGQEVLGTDSQRRRKIPGKPKASHVLQLGIYHWWSASQNENYEDSILLYGDRGSGKFAEYKLRTVTDESGLIRIETRMNSPFVSEWADTGITINSVLNDGYGFVEKHLLAGRIPDRDFDAVYSEDQMWTLYERGQLTKTDTKQMEKILERKKENEALIAEGKKPKQELKLPQKGSWHCNYCSFKNFCYGANGEPIKD